MYHASINRRLGICRRAWRNVNPNGFTEGEHYNLNIIGKNENFSCPCDYEPTEEVWDDTLEAYVTKYKNVIFIPEYNDGKKLRFICNLGKAKGAIMILTLS